MACSTSSRSSLVEQQRQAAEPAQRRVAQQLDHLPQLGRGIGGARQGGGDRVFEQAGIEGAHRRVGQRLRHPRTVVGEEGDVVGQDLEPAAR